MSKLVFIAVAVGMLVSIGIASDQCQEPQPSGLDSKPRVYEHQDPAPRCIRGTFEHYRANVIRLLLVTPAVLNDPFIRPERYSTLILERSDPERATETIKLYRRHASGGPYG